MSTIIVRKFDERRRRYGRYELDPNDGSFRLTYCAHLEDAQRHAVGYGDEVTVGLVRRFPLFVALYVRGIDLILRIGRDELTAGVGGLRVERSACFPFVKQFEVWETEGLRYSWRYWFVDNPDRFSFGPEATDILLKASLVLSDSRASRRFAYKWNAIAAGRNTTTQEFDDEISAL